MCAFLSQLSRMKHLPPTHTRTHARTHARTHTHARAHAHTHTRAPRLQTNRHLSAACYRCEKVGYFSREAACLWDSVFKIRANIAAQAKRHLRRIYGEPSPTYTAVHMRLGGLTGEGDFARQRTGGSALDTFIAAIGVANRLSAESNITAPTLVITDNHALREFIKVGPLGRP